MSVYTYTSRFFSLSPRIWIEDGVLCARTNLLVQVLLLFSVCRLVRIDRQRQEVKVVGRYWWALDYAQRIAFEQIRKINYQYSSRPLSWAWLFGRTDEIDVYRIGLRLQSGEDVDLFRFVGDGSVETGWAGVLLGGDDVVDCQGTQYDESRTFIDLIAKVTGKTLT